MYSDESLSQETALKSFTAAMKTKDDAHAAKMKVKDDETLLIETARKKLADDLDAMQLAKVVV
jgi:hypothetical protein